MSKINKFDPPLYHQLGARALSGAVGSGFGYFAISSVFSRVGAISVRPDLNGDGKFTIMDIPQAIFSCLTEVGDRYQILLLKSRFREALEFLEMSDVQPNLFWSVILSLFTYSLAIYAIAEVFAPLERHNKSAEQ